MSDYSHTKSRVLQWLGIILIIAVFAGAYWYFQVYGSTLNKSPTGLLTNGLIGYWTFDGGDISSTTATDRGSGGNNGTLTGGVSTSQGKIGQALSFDGVNDYVDTGSRVGPASGYTSCVWAKPSSVSGAKALISAYKDNDGDKKVHNQFFIYDDGFHGRIFDTYSGEFRYIGRSVASGISANVWTHLCMTWDGGTTASAIKLYQNGTQVDTTNDNGGTFTAVSTDSVHFWIGAQEYLGGPNGLMTGALDEVRVYSRALAATEIQSLYTLGQSDLIASSVSQPQGMGRLDSGLAGYWALDNGSGTSATDSSTNGNTGTLTGGPTWTTGQIGSAVTFDGSDDYIRVPNSTALNPDYITVAAWIKTSATGVLDQIITKDDYTGGKRVWQFRKTTSNTLEFIVFRDSDDTNYQASGVVTITDNNWHHVAGTWDGVTIRVFVDGRQDGTGAAFSGVLNAGQNNDVIIGSSELNGDPGYLPGQIDEARIYSRALSADEISQLYRLTSPTSVDTGLKGYWDFDAQDIGGGVAYDRSGAGKYGHPTGGPTKVMGKIGQALSFDGTNDYVIIPPSGSGFEVATTVSYSAWIKPSALPGSSAVIVEKLSSGSEHKGLYLDSAGKIYFYLHYVSGGVALYSSTVIAVNTWYHVAATYDGSTEKIYINGVLDSSQAASGDVGDGSNYFHIGASDFGISSRFSGVIDEVRAYNRTLTVAEIKAQYDAGESDKLNSSVSQAQGTGRLDSGLNAYFSLDDGTSGATPTTANDSSTNGNAGTLTGGPTWTTGQIGSAVDFDGTDDYITVSDADTLDVVDSRNFTLSGWFNRDTFTTDDTILAKSNGQAASDTGYNVYIDDSTDKVTFVANDGTDQYKLESTSTFTATGWHHYTVVWDDSGSGQTKLYIDGTYEAATATGTFSNVNSLANSVAFRLGAESDAGNPFDGKLDEARLYSRALLSDEVAQLYRLTTPTRAETNLKGYWSFNGQDMSGTTAYDRSGAGNTGTLTNGPTKTVGKIGQALSFDNTDDYVSIADNSVLDVTDVQFMTLTGWFYRTGTGSGHVLLAKRNGTLAAQTGYAAYISSVTNKLVFEVSDGTDEYSLDSTSTFTTTANPGWNHFAIVWDPDSAANTEIYINGVADSATDTGTIGDIGDLSNALVLAIGAQSDADTPFQGKLDEIRLYKSALPAAQIASLYNQGR